MVWPSHHRDAQNNYDLDKINVEWSAQNNDYDLEKINVEWSGTHLKIMSTRSWYKKNALEKNRWREEMFTNKNWSCLTQNYYDLEKINVEWSGPLTTVSPKIYITSEK